MLKPAHSGRRNWTELTMQFNSVQFSCVTCVVICGLRRILNTIDQTTACTIVTSLIHSKIDYCNSLLYSIYLLHKRIVFNLPFTLLLVLSPKLLNFITLFIFLNLSTKINERIKYKVLSHTPINILNLVNLPTSALFFHSHHIVVLGLLLLSSSSFCSYLSS